MKRLHVNLTVSNLAESIRFYSTLFAGEPTVTKSDYAKWLLDDPRVNFSIIERPANTEGHGIQHLGIQAETQAELVELRQRLSTQQDKVFDEGETVCCYHASDKAWVNDPQEVSWELFYTSGEATVRREPAAAKDRCCDATCCT